MKWRHWKVVTVITLVGVTLCAATYAAKEKKKAKQAAPTKLVPSAAEGTEQPAEVERKVTEAEVPAAALAALKKLAWHGHLGRDLMGWKPMPRKKLSTATHFTKAHGKTLRGQTLTCWSRLPATWWRSRNRWTPTKSRQQP